MCDYPVVNLPLGKVDLNDGTAHIYTHDSQLYIINISVLGLSIKLMPVSHRCNDNSQYDNSH